MADMTQFLPAKSKLLEFVAKQEPWCVYELEDGTIIRARLVITKIIATDQLDANGLPLFNLQFQQITDVTHTEAAVDAARKRADQ